MLRTALNQALFGPYLDAGVVGLGVVSYVVGELTFVVKTDAAHICVYIYVHAERERGHVCVLIHIICTATKVGQMGRQPLGFWGMCTHLYAL